MTFKRDYISYSIWRIFEAFHMALDLCHIEYSILYAPIKQPYEVLHMAIEFDLVVNPKALHLTKKNKKKT